MREIASVQAGFRFLLELEPPPDGRLQGTLERLGTSERVPFSGTLELLKVIEDALAQPAAGPHALGSGDSLAKPTPDG